MNVRLGWSGDIHGTWTKMDVEVAEEDLILHFIEAGVEDATRVPISALEKFKLMYSLAEIFVQLHKMSRFPEYFGKDEDKQELQELLNMRDKLTKQIMERASGDDRPPF